MNSRNCSSNFSTTLLRETLKKTWILGAFSAAAYICVIILPVLINRSDAFYVGSMFSGGGVEILFTVCFPLIISMTIWSFLNSQGSVATFHALPYSRKQIYNSSNLAGLIITEVPVLITGLLILLIRLASGPFYVTGAESALMEDAGAAATAVADTAARVDCLPVSQILLWTGFVVILNIAVYLVATLASMISGMPGIRLALAFILMFSIPTAILIIDFLADVMLYGFTCPEWIYQLAYYSSPVTAFFHEIKGSFAVNVIIIYLIVSLILYALGLIAYQRRPLEKAGDTLIFTWTKPFLTCLAGFYGAGLGGLGFYYIFSQANLVHLYIGAVAGGLFCFLAVNMIIQKTPKIRGFWKSLALVVAVMIIFFGAFAADFAGFEKNVPEADDVSDVSIQGFLYTESEDTSEVYIDNPEFIKNIIGLHKELTETEKMSDNIVLRGECVYRLDNGDLVYSEESLDSDSNVKEVYAPYEYSCVQLDYRLKNGHHILREYYVPSGWLRESSYAQAVSEYE